MMQHKPFKNHKLLITRGGLNRYYSPPPTRNLGGIDCLGQTDTAGEVFPGRMPNQA